MGNFWRKYPFLRLLLPLALGTVAGKYLAIFPFPAEWLLCALLAGWGLLGFFAVRPLLGAGGKAYAVLVFLWIALAGYYSMSRWLEGVAPELAGSEQFYYGWISEAAPTSGGGNKATLHLRGAGSDPGHLDAVRGKLMAYFPAGTMLVNGSGLMLRGQVRALSSVYNPYAFDYNAYLRRKGFAGTVYVQEGAVFAAEESGVVLFQRIAQYRQMLRARLEAAVRDPRLQDILLALTLGDKSTMDKEVKEVFQRAGAMHLLAVSGLHLGIVAWILGLGVRRLPLPEMGRAGLQLAGIWSYALLTGGAPSVIRAGIMFSLLLVARARKEDHNIWNAIAGAAFLMLLVRPANLWDVGFQLSFLALTGILFFQPILYRSWLPAGKVADRLWQLFTVGLAAQVSTFPLTIYYFNQFPSYFWLSGMTLVPVTGILLGGGLLLILVAGQGWLGTALTLLVGRTAYVYQRITEMIAGLPGALITEVWLETWEVFAFYLVLILWMIWWRSKKFVVLRAAMVLLLGWSVLHCWQRWRIHFRPELVVYATSRGYLVDLWAGNERWTFYDPEAAAAEPFVAAAYRYRKPGQRVRRYSLPEDAALRISTPEAEVLYGLVEAPASRERTPVFRLLDTGQPPPAGWRPGPAETVVLAGSHRRNEERWIRLLENTDATYWSLGRRGALVWKSSK